MGLLLLGSFSSPGSCGAPTSAERKQLKLGEKSLQHFPLYFPTDSSWRRYSTQYLLHQLRKNTDITELTLFSSAHSSQLQHCNSPTQNTLQKHFLQRVKSLRSGSSIGLRHPHDPCLVWSNTFSHTTKYTDFLNWEHSQKEEPYLCKSEFGSL